jgi:hypothetical protein
MNGMTAKWFGCIVHAFIISWCAFTCCTQSQGYETKKIETIITDSLCCKARLLHYFARDENRDENKNDEGQTVDDMDFSDWCGWHNDHVSVYGIQQYELRKYHSMCALFI